MHVNRRTKTRTRSVTAKVTTDEEQLLQECAKQEGLTVSEWSRRALLNAVDSSPDARLLLSELLALRMLFLGIHTDVLQGKMPTGQHLKELIGTAEKEKFASADQRIHTYRVSQALKSASVSGEGDS